MKYKNIKFGFFIIALSFFTFSNVFSQNNEREILIETNFGNIKLKLYNETPKHRDNFLRLVSENYFDSLLFHRVINNFMIQGGDPDSKNAPKGKLLGDGGPDYTIAAEFNKNLFHKKGVLAAAREGDKVNPEKRSSASQFYIVQGQVFTNEQLDKMENAINQRRKQEFIINYLNKKENKALKNKLDSLQKNKKTNEIESIILKIEKDTQEEFNKNYKLTYTTEQRKIYKSIGGTPHLDGSYTVFGEVVEGLDVVDKIATVKTDKNNRPLKDVVMKIKIIK
ncbi:MAG: peptidylprolyl isomerase [Bacteroidetes bacterium]|nr:MAG: peptidylprolyl isomerase [Bacteroidota bacterium]